MKDHEKIRIAFFDTKPYDRKFFDQVNSRTDFGFKLIYFETRLTPNSVSMAEGADIVCAFVNDDVCASVVDRLVHCGVKLLAMRCAGYNNVNLAAAYGKLPVVRVPEYSPYAVAEYTLGLLICMNRNIHRAYCRVRENNFSINGFLGFDLHGKTVGVIGTGKIGRTFIGLLRGFGVRVLAFDPYPNRAAEELGAEYTKLDSLLAQSDVISLHCPLTADNLHLINEDSIAQCKPGVIILNTSRGKLIDSAALIRGLKDGTVGGACLDVYEEETDYFFEDCSETAIDDDILARLMTFPNVIISSHQAFFTREAMNNIAAVTLTNVLDLVNNRELVNAVCYKCDGSRNCPGKQKGHNCRPSA